MVEPLHLPAQLLQALGLAIATLLGMQKLSTLQNLAKVLQPLQLHNINKKTYQTRYFSGFFILGEIYIHNLLNLISGLSAYFQVLKSTIQTIW